MPLDPPILDWTPRAQCPGKRIDGELVYQPDAAIWAARRTEGEDNQWVGRCCINDGNGYRDCSIPTPLLHHIPEPSALAMQLVGVAALAVIGRRRARQAKCR